MTDVAKSSDTTFPADDKKSKDVPASLQAVVVIHGMGEQRPMDTIKSFVHAVWETDEVVTRNGLPDSGGVWSKPEVRTGSLELRRITTRESVRRPPPYPNGVRTDFYELYWADLTAGSTWNEFTGWVAGLLFRSWRHVPRNLHLAWLLLWLATIVVVILAVLGLVDANFWTANGFPLLARFHWLVAALSVGLMGLLHRAASATFGRVVRYTKADPDNIAARQAVRERGLKLLRALHEGNQYTRIVIVSHSLGTMLALDLIGYFWAEREASRTICEETPEFQTLCNLETCAAEIAAGDTSPEVLDHFADEQYALRVLLANRATAGLGVAARWLISDFVTLGSPLTHAEVLLAANRDDLFARVSQRELCISPPFRELLDPKVIKRVEDQGQLPLSPRPPQSGLFCYPDPNKEKLWYLHHAAPFAVVRWTNIFDPSVLVVCGDIIGGPLADIFGPAIVDVDLRALRKKQSWSFTHTDYWTLNSDSRHIDALRGAVNLLNLAPASLPDYVRFEGVPTSARP